MKKILFTAFCLLLISCGESNLPEENISGEALGTTYHITYFPEDDIALKKALDSIFFVVNRSMSTYQPDSDISRLNRGDTTIKVDTLFQNVFKLSEKVYEETGGYFDPTVGDLVNMYGFGPEKQLNEIDSTTVDSLMEFVGLDKIRISAEGKVTKDAPEIYLDFNAIAKGYTVDLIGHYLIENGVENFLVELGGELLARGKNIDKNAAWKLGIDDPNQVPGSRSLTAIVKLGNQALATSGNYRKFRIDPETGEKYVHTINPLTGYPGKSNLLSASVLAENCALADAYATAFMALGFEPSVELLESLENIEAFLIYSGEDGTVEEFATPGFEKQLLQE